VFLGRRIGARASLLSLSTIERDGFVQTHRGDEMKKSDYEDLNVAQIYFYEHRRELLARLNGKLAKIDLEELAQRVFSELEKIDDKSFSALDNQHAFVFKVVKRRAIDMDRQHESRTGHGKEVAVDSYEPLWVPSAATNPEDTIIATLFVKQIWKRLSKEEKQLLSYHFFDGRDSNEIAQLMGLTPPTVRQRLKRLLQKLREDPP
jgi:RNA polymerase sigma-70 factor (ECF subfamily)